MIQIKNMNSVACKTCSMFVFHARFLAARYRLSATEKAAVSRTHALNSVQLLYSSVQDLYLMSRFLLVNPPNC